MLCQNKWKSWRSRWFTQSIIPWNFGTIGTLFRPASLPSSQSTTPANFLCLSAKESTMATIKYRAPPDWSNVGRNRERRLQRAALRKPNRRSSCPESSFVTAEFNRRTGWVLYFRNNVLLIFQNLHDVISVQKLNPVEKSIMIIGLILRSKCLWLCEFCEFVNPKLCEFLNCLTATNLDPGGREKTVKRSSE